MRAIGLEGFIDWEHDLGPLVLKHFGHNIHGVGEVFLVCWWVGVWLWSGLPAVRASCRGVLGVVCVGGGGGGPKMSNASLCVDR